MAIAHLAPADDDLVTIEEAVALLRGTPYEPSDATIRRWIRKYRLRTTKIGKPNYVSFSALLEVHREAVRLRAGA